MAYVITINDNIFKIAANDADKNQINAEFPPYVAHSISDADFEKLKTNSALATVTNGSIVITDKTDTNFTEEALKEYHKGLILTLDFFLNPNNQSKTFYSTAETYKNYLLNLDYSSLTFPLNSSWEKYCADNSISYLNPLQLP